MVPSKHRFRSGYASIPSKNFVWQNALMIADWIVRQPHLPACEHRLSACAPGNSERELCARLARREHQKGNAPSIPRVRKPASRNGASPAALAA